MEKPLYSFSCERRLQDRDFESRKGGNGGGNLLHLAEHFFMFSLLFVRTLCLFSHCFLSFCSSSSFRYAVLISHLRFFFFFWLFISLPWASFCLSLSLSSNLCIIIHGLSLFWPVRSGGSSPFTFFSFLLLLLLDVLFGGIIRFIHFIMRKCGQSRPMIWFQHLKEA